MNAEMAKDLAELVSSLKGMKKDKEVTVKTEKGTYKFMYAPLSTILDKIKENKKFSLLQPIFYVDGVAYMENWLIHITGDELKSGLYKLAFKDGMKMQEFGNVITYTRRYSLGAFLGVSTDDEDDSDPELEPKQPEKPAGPKLCSPDQIAVLRHYYGKNEADWTKFLEKNNISQIEDLPYSIAEIKIQLVQDIAKKKQADAGIQQG